MTLTLDTRTQAEIDERRRQITAARRILSAFEDHQLVELPYGLPGAGRGGDLYPGSAEQVEMVTAALRSWGFTFGDLEDAGQERDASGRTVLACRPFSLDGHVVGRIVARREGFLPSDVATVGLIGAVFGTAPWAEEPPSDYGDHDVDPDPEPEDADCIDHGAELPR